MGRWQRISEKGLVDSSGLLIWFLFATGLTFGDDNRLKAAVSVARDINRQLAEFTLDDF
jgi:hypothetical protein